MSGVSVEDAGSYECGIARLGYGEFIRDTRTISVEVATNEVLMSKHIKALYMVELSAL